MKKIIFIFTLLICAVNLNAQTTIINCSSEETIKILPFKYFKGESIHNPSIVDVVNYDCIKGGQDVYFNSFWNPIRILKYKRLVNSQYIVFHINDRKVTIKLKKRLTRIYNVLEIHDDFYIMRYQDDPNEIKEIKVNYPD